MKFSTHDTYLSVLLLLLALTFVFMPSLADAAVWQWSIPVTGGTDKAGPATAFLWIPQSSIKVRAVVVCQNNMEEEMILENPKFRAALAKLNYAEIWVSPAFDHLFLFNQGAGDVFNGMMSDLAATSGYHELNYVPIIPLGHSAAASWPYYFAAWAPQRTLAAISVSGQWPYWRNPSFAPDIWGDKTIDDIPCLETMGEYEGADSWSREGVWERQQHPQLALSMAAGPAQSHFFAADEKIDYLILYIQKADQYRMPKEWDGSAAPQLIPIDPTKTGWLADKWQKDAVPTAPAAPVAQYSGDPKQTFWFFDQQMAAATLAYESNYRNLKVDLIGYLQDGAVVPQTNSHQQVNLKFEPDADGITFHLATAFLDTVPGESTRPADWTGLPAGSPVGHASDTAPIVINKITGPFVETAPGTFQVSFEKGLGANLNSYQLWFAATQPGDSEYKPIVQQAEMIIPARNTNGTPQTITFPTIPNQKVGGPPVTLSAVSSSGMPVHYYVLSGPAQINANAISFTQVPPKTKFPVAVTVVAWQYGSSVAPQVQSAAPVSQTFYLVKN